MSKRIFDLFFATMGLLLISPLLVLISIGIKIDSKGPIFFRQKRVGRNGICFFLIKFRSMHVLSENLNTISVRGDDRITLFGKFLRRYKLDELPELWNVVNGEMSLVGPRPDVPGYADNLQNNDRLVLKMRPGITGPASIKYANEELLLSKQDNPRKYNDEVIFPDKVRINLEYYNNRSLYLDIKIIFATIFRTSYK